MKPFAFSLPALLLSAAPLFAQNPPMPPVAATLTVQVDQPGKTISPNLYGVFFEEINHSGDGGLYAEMVRNRDFNDTRNPLDGWKLELAPGTQGTAALDIDRPLNMSTPRALKLTATNTTFPMTGKVDKGSSAVSVVNEGFWGMGIQAGQSYNLSFYARRGATATPLTIALIGKNGEVYASQIVRNIGTDWNRVGLTLKPNATVSDARLKIGLNAPGEVWLDVVSLFPQSTFKNRPNGLRADLAQKVADMKPAFIRFPGGCYVEGGDHYANAFRWKTTVGDIAARPGHLNDTWGYWSTDGLGYHEYLQMCEDMGATALFVVNCGMAHRSNVPLGELQPWIDEALEAIEYANGPANSRWGALRAKNGHPKPFNLRYLEVGNENGGPLYEERYALFVDALKAKHPEIRLIANVPAQSRPVDIVDEHYYNTPDWFWDNSAMYDRRNRATSPKVYVGEYAVTQGAVGKGNLRAALSEAAWMNGMERNSDLVEMSSYAPLLVNVQNRAWSPDAIGFNSAASFGTPSYYVQKLYGQNRPDRLLPSRIQAMLPAPPASGGTIGLGTWATQAEFKEIEVTAGGKELYRSHFPDGAADWQTAEGDWKVVDGAYRQNDNAVAAGTGNGSGRLALLQSPALSAASDYTLHLKARKIGGSEGFLIAFRSRDRASWTWWNIGGWGNTRHGLEKSVGGIKGGIGDAVAGNIATNRWYDVRIELQGDRVRCYLDNQLIHDVTDGPQQRVNAVAGVEKNGDIVLKVVNGLDAPLTTQVDLQGARGLRPTAQKITLNGAPDDENTLDAPLKVAPVETVVNGVTPRFSHTFAPHSLTVLRFKAR